ncbi:hypothetical protein [Chitinophaga sp. MM2321]|uniref:hypothetical protein n=1 Tax=Chitinophaga sp. MM2321 TaxID=3137178 RepID=UPI0032D5AD4B
MQKKTQIVKVEPVNLALKAIELLDNTIHYPGDRPALTSFNFNLNITSKADEEKRLLFVIVKVDVANENIHHLLGSITVSSIYTIDNFDEVVKINASGQPDMPEQLIETLHSTSLSTTRGVMFATFKGTFLHNALLPIIIPGSLIEEINK